MPKLSAFQRAFKEARDRGDAEFEFGGKQYNTKYKEEADTSSKPEKKLAAPPMQDASKMSGEAVGSRMSLPAEQKNYEFGSVPTSEQAAANRQKAADRLKSIGSSVSDYFANFETPAERRSRESKEAKGYKSGGSVSSASKRADGIAQRGKTRGKIC